MTMFMDVNGYAIKLKGDSISVIGTDKDGNQMELCFAAGDAYDLAGLMNEMFNEYMDRQAEERADTDGFAPRKSP